MAITEVYLREELTNIKVKVTSLNKPDIPGDIVDNWQRIVNIMSEILDVPSGLIMKINQNKMEVFLSSERLDNPYEKGDRETLKTGLYCETVIGRNEALLVKDSLNNAYWKDNPDLKLGMISYYGLPILWPDEETFGTICVLDHKKNEFNEKYKKLIMAFKISIEKDLKLILLNDALHKSAHIDVLTKICNRRKCIEIIKNEIDRSIRGNTSFSIALMDIDKFKQINDTYGHKGGDDLLKKFTNLFTKNIRGIDSFCRWGGDEFILVCPNTDKDGINNLINKVKDKLNDKPKFFYNIDFSFGVATFKATDQTYEDIISRADHKMYILKKSK